MRLIAALLVLTALPAAAQGTIESDPTASLFLGQFSPDQSAKIAPGVAAYAKAARAWWIEDHCHLAAALHADNFAGDLAGLTGAMKGLFVSQLGATPEQAAKQVRQIQVFALEQMTSARFYNCGDQARTVFQQGYDVTEHVADTARQRAAQPQK
jgi:hypothetical protein